MLEGARRGARAARRVASRANAAKGLSSREAREARAEGGPSRLRGGAGALRRPQGRRRSAGPTTPFGKPPSRITPSCIATRAASPIRSGASATVTGIYFQGDGRRPFRQFARAQFSHGEFARLPAGSLQFVDFSKPDPGRPDSRAALHDCRTACDGRGRLFAGPRSRLVYAARDAEPTNAAVLRLMTLAFWQSGNLDAAARAVRDWARVEGEPAPFRTASPHAIYEDHWRDRTSLPRAADRAAARAPFDAGCLGARSDGCALRLMDRSAALAAFANGAGASSARRPRGCSTSRSPSTLAGDVGR